MGQPIVMELDLLIQDMKETRIWSLGQEDPWRRKWQPTPVFLPGESHGQKTEEPGGPQSVGSQSVMTELTHTHSSRSLELELIDDKLGETI